MDGSSNLLLDSTDSCSHFERVCCVRCIRITGIIKLLFTLSKLHLVVIILFGRYAIRAVLFPYANKLVTNFLDG
jgi:uncharacterized membrane protein YjdF